MGDEITDIWYVIDNWDKFANQDLKNASVVFIVLPFCIFLLNTPRLMKKDQYFKDYSCWYYPIFIFATWTKLVIYFKKCHQNNQGQKSSLQILGKRKFLSTLGLFHTSVEWIFEDIPQIIIQTVNNNQNEDWDEMKVISISFSLIMLILAPCLFVHQLITSYGQYQKGEKQIDQESALRMKRWRMEWNQRIQSI